MNDENGTFIAFDSINGEYEDFDNIKDAQEYLEEVFMDEDEGYNPDMDGCKIFELRQVVECTIVDSKENYKYENEEDAPEGCEDDVWPHDNAFDEIWKHRFVEDKPKDAKDPKGENLMPTRRCVFFSLKDGKYMTENGIEITTEMLVKYPHQITEVWSFIILD